MDLRPGRPRVFKIYLTGQVKNPGPTDATGTARVYDVLTNVAMQDNASHRHIDIKHTDGSRETADLDLFARTGDQSLNPGFAMAM